MAMDIKRIAMVSEINIISSSIVHLIVASCSNAVSIPIKCICFHHYIRIVTRRIHDGDTIPKSFS